VGNKKPRTLKRQSCGARNTICDSRLAVFWQEGDPLVPFRSRNWTCIDRWVTS